MDDIQFSLEDQIWFSEISGDANPIHVNQIYSRKSLFGEVIVHGIHLVIFALDELYNQVRENITLNTLNVTFLKPVKLGQKVSFEIAKKAITEAKIKLIVDGSPITVLDLSFSINDNPSELNLKFNTEDFSIPEEFTVFEGERSLALGIYKEGIENKYPNLKHVLTSNQLLNLLAITRIVGMKSPGLNSIFSSFILNFKSGSQNSKLGYQIKSYKKSYSRLVLSLDSETINGSLVAFLRPTSTSALSPKKASELVERINFKGQRALIIGGSRGLGAITTKLLWAGGAEILFSYHKGENEAKGIIEELNSSKINCFKFDVTCEMDEATKAIVQNFNPTHIYYYVTPFIFSTNKGSFNFDSFVNFSSYYLKGFYDLIQFCQHGALTHVFYPSSIAIDDLVDNMIEYSCSKVAGELLCDFLVKMNPNLRILRTRFPRLDTDQTQSLLHIDGVDTNKKILESIIEFVNL